MSVAIMTVDGVTMDVPDELDIFITVPPEGAEITSITVTLSGGRLDVKNPDGAAFTITSEEGGCIFLGGTQGVTTDPYEGEEKLNLGAKPRDESQSTKDFWQMVNVVAHCPGPRIGVISFSHKNMDRKPITCFIVPSGEVSHKINMMLSEEYPDGPDTQELSIERN